MCIIKVKTIFRISTPLSSLFSEKWESLDYLVLLYCFLGMEQNFAKYHHVKAIIFSQLNQAVDF